ncbi:gap junction gamma-1 protein-like [Lethenteron reissneri]|uniref:gap junction gamma-1 protein-like n=2 Tax=Lethenteron reissneri TaxID=7753 RepID=UPI002AB6C906|nr:gap junction gamma-1 protein-like [Lethenteron reissneri]
MSWGYLTQLLDEVHRHSTFLSKLWITIFLIFRIVLTTVAGESIYYDEQGQFTCNTAQPGCENVCYDSFAPLSHVRFWVFQIIVVATPTILYLGFAVHRITRIEYERDERTKRTGGSDRMVECTEKEEEVEEEVEWEVEEGEEDGKEKRRQGNERWRIKTDGLMVAYTLQLLARTLAEIGFLLGQYLLYGFEVAPRFQCVRDPCPNRVDCFVSRPTEKTIFLLVMYTVAGLSLLLELSEICYLGLGALHDSLSGRCWLQSRSAEGKQAAHTTLEASRVKVAVARGSRRASLAPPGYHSVLGASSDGNGTGVADPGEPDPPTAVPAAATMSPRELRQLRDELRGLETELRATPRPRQEPPGQSAGGGTGRTAWV